MADQPLQSPRNPHFFQPLLPDFHTHLNIPVSFFSKYIEGRTNHKKTAQLRSDASDETWTVKMDGLKLTDGWEDFAVAHDLRIGDMTVFRHEGEMVFHVTALGPSCCEIQYASSHNNINDQTNIGNSSRKRVKKNPRKEEEESSRFVANVSAWNLNKDRLYLPLSFARSNGLHKMNGEKIVLVNERGRSWDLDLRHSEASTQTYARPGWRSFCAANGMKQGQYTFKLVQKSGPPIIRLCRAAEAKPESEPEQEPDHSCFDVSVTSSSLEADKLTLPRRFVTANGLDKGCSEIVLKNGWGGRWTLVLKDYESCRYTHIKRGWTSFCQVNGIKAGDSVMFQLVEAGETPVLSLCPCNGDKTPLECPEDSDDVCSLSSDTSSEDDSRESQESEEESLGDKSVSEECLEVEKKKNFSRCRASSSYSQESDPKSSLQHSCYVGVVTPSGLEYDKLYLPRKFVAENGLKKGCSEIVLKNKWGRRWTLALKNYESQNQTYVGPGWTTFCQVNRIKAGDPFMFKLVETGEKPVLSLCPSNSGKRPLKCPEDSDDDSSRSQESEEEKSVSDECLEVEKKKKLSRFRASSSCSQDQFVRLTLTPSVFKSYKLSLPRSFTRANGIHKPGKITLLSQDGVKQVVDLLQEKASGSMRFGKGWREFCEANGVKINESFVLELFWEDEVSPVFKFCRKVDSV